MWRLGIVNLDSSHSVEFTRRFNQLGVERDQYVDGARVVMACPGRSEMAPERIPGFQKEMQSMGVPLVADPAELIERIDAVLILSLSGVMHLEQAWPFLEAGIPTFVDKPFTCSVVDASALIERSQSNHTLMFSASALRYAEETLATTRRREELGGIHGAITYGPAKRADGNPGLFHYGVHSVELLFELLGPGCESVTTTWTPEAEVVTGYWSDGRIGTVRGNRSGSTTYGFTAFTGLATVQQAVSTRYAYRNLCSLIVRALDSGEPPVSHTSSLQVVQFISAALESEQRRGERMPLRTV